MPWIAIILAGVIVMQIGNILMFTDHARILKALADEVDRAYQRMAEHSKEHSRNG